MPKELITLLSATFGIPLVMLVLDYVYRRPLVQEALLKSGPDLCLFSLGSSGVVFIDPRVATAFSWLPLTHVLIFVIVAILVLRQTCHSLNDGTPSMTKAVASCCLGLASVTLMSAILYIAYTHPR
jgi:hypothetical protein